MGTHRHRDLVLLEVPNELDDAGQRLDRAEQAVELGVHGRQELVDRERDAGLLDQACRSIVCWSAHELGLDLPGHLLAVRGEDGVGRDGVEALRVDHEPVLQSVRVSSLSWCINRAASVRSDPSVGEDPRERTS